MTSKRTDLEVNVTARADQAKRELGQVADDAERLEDIDPEVTVGLDDDVTDELADIRTKLDGLSDADREIAIRANIAQLERQIGNAERALGRLDRFEQSEIDVRLEARDNASRKIDALQAELRQLDGETADVRVDATGVDDIRTAFSDLTGGAGAGGVGVIAAGKAGLIGGAIGGAVVLGEKFSDAALQAQAIADRFGTSVELASQLLALADLNGLEFSDVFDLLAQFNQAIADSPELADKLKIDPADNTIDQFLTAVENLRTEVDGVGERGIIAAQLFGEEGVRQVQLIESTVGDLRRAIDEIPDSRVFTDDDVRRAREFKSNVQEMKGYLQDAVVQAGFLVEGINGAFEAAKNNQNPGGGFAVGVIEGLVDQLFPGPVGRSNRNNPVATGAVPLTPELIAQLSGRYATGRVPGTGSRQGAGDTIIINPPGTPTATIEQQRLYNYRNGNRPV